MIDQSLPLIGPAAKAYEVIKTLASQRGSLAVLLEGNPGVGKSHLLDKLALELTGSKFAIEHVNGQSLNIQLVREWRERACYGNLFSDWTIKRIDELDLASPAATAELLSYLDYLQPRMAILATTNDYAKLRATSKGRLETRFNRFHIGAPTVTEGRDYLVAQFGIAPGIAETISRGAVPDGCLITEGVNMRCAVEDGKAFLAAKQTQQLAA